MQRGDVCLIKLHLPDRVTGTGTTERTKYVVVLQGGGIFDTATDMAVVVCSSARYSGKPLRPFEVLVGPSHGFDHETVIDCRWVMTVPKPTAPLSVVKFRLSPDVMNEVSAAIVVGLQM